MAKMDNKGVTKVAVDQGPWAWILFTAWVGAVIYFFQLDQTFWGFILALLKAAVWPAYVLYESLGALGVV